MGWTSIPKEKKGTCRRPKKSLQGDLLYADVSILSSPNSSSLPTCNSKRTWKRIVDKKLNSLEMKGVGPDLGEKRKVAEIESEEDHSVEVEKKKKIKVCLTTQTAEIA